MIGMDAQGLLTLKGVLDKLDNISIEELKEGLPLLLFKLNEVQKDVVSLKQNLTEVYGILNAILDDNSEFEFNDVDSGK